MKATMVRKQHGLRCPYCGEAQSAKPGKQPKRPDREVHRCVKCKRHYCYTTAGCSFPLERPSDPESAPVQNIPAHLLNR